jgi:obg-like ATPase 1
VPDERFDALVSAHKPKSVVPAVLTVTDIAGLVKGAAEGAGLGNAFLSNIQAVDGIFHVCRAFAGDEIVHVEGRVDPVADLEIIHNELRLKDAATLATQIESKRKGVERGLGGKDAKAEFMSLEKIAAWVGEGKDVRMGEWGAVDVEVLNKLQLLTAKPVVYLVNLSEKDYIRKRNKFLEPLAAWVKALGQEDKILPFSCEFEAKIFEMEPEAREAYCKEHATKSIMPRIIKTGYHALGLVHFFTAGPDEVRAWTIKEATPAPNAAGTIHTDFLKNFIAAESAWGARDTFFARRPRLLPRPPPPRPPASLLVRRLEGEQPERGGGQGGGQVPHEGQAVRDSGRRHLLLQDRAVDGAHPFFHNLVLQMAYGSPPTRARFAPGAAPARTSNPASSHASTTHAGTSPSGYMVAMKPRAKSG